jgi:tetratricopeptide (TPR) repeat protein
MKPLAVILISTVLAAGAAALTVKILEPSRAAEGTPPTEQLRERINSLESNITGLRKDLAEMKSAKPAAPESSARVSNADIESAVARWLEKNSNKVAGAVAPANGNTKSGAAATDDVAAMVAKLRDSRLNASARHELWQAVNKAGITDKVVEAMEAYVKDNPGSADAQCDLGNAYIMALQFVPDGPEKGKFAIKADSSYDKSLEIDPRHWEARFSKATALSFWPPIFGKQNEAISQFETLRKQQEEAGGVKPEYAQTYQFLGNLYDQAGKADKAAEVWQKGASLFPDNASLKQAAAGKSGK